MNFDSNGLIVTLKNDGGDSCSEEGRYWFLYWLNFVLISNYDITLKLPRREHPSILTNKLEVSPGIYVRNPLDHNTPETTSRDQLLPIIWYCAAYKDYKRLWRLFVKVLLRGGFAQNYIKNGKFKIPDQMWTSMGAFIRAGSWYTQIFYPVLLLFDTLELIDILIAVLVPYTWNSEFLIWYKPNTWFTLRSLGDVDDNNRDISLLAATWFKATPISFLNRIIWGKFRPPNLGNTVLGYKNNCLAAIAWYHDPSNNGNIEIVELYRVPIETFLRGKNG